MAHHWVTKVTGCLHVDFAQTNIHTFPFFPSHSTKRNVEGLPLPEPGGLSKIYRHAVHLKVVKNTTMTNDLACVMVKVFAPQTRCIADNRRKGIDQSISQLILLIGSWFTTPWTLTTSWNSCLKHITSPTMFAVHSKLRRERLTHAETHKP